MTTSAVVGSQRNSIRVSSPLVRKPAQPAVAAHVSVPKLRLPCPSRCEDIAHWCERRADEGETREISQAAAERWFPGDPDGERKVDLILVAHARSHESAELTLRGAAEVGLSDARRARAAAFSELGVA